MNIWTWNNETKEMTQEAEVKIGQEVRVSYNYSHEVDGQTLYGKGRVTDAQDKKNLVKLASPSLYGQKGQVIGKLEVGDGGSRGAKRVNELVVVSFERLIFDLKLQKDVRVVERLDPRALSTADAFDQAQAAQEAARLKQDAQAVKRFLGKGQKFDELTSEDLTKLSQDLTRAQQAIQTRKVELDLAAAMPVEVEVPVEVVETETVAV